MMRVMGVGGRRGGVGGREVEEEEGGGGGVGLDCYDGWIFAITKDQFITVLSAHATNIWN